MDLTCLLMNKRNVLFASIRNSLFDIFHLRYTEKGIIHYLNYNTLNHVAILYILNTNPLIVSNTYWKTKVPFDSSISKSVLGEICV